MKVFFSVILSCFFISCSSNNANGPEKKGKIVFDILTHLSEMSKQQFIDHFLSIEEIRSIAKNKDLISDEDERNELTSMLKEEWETRLGNEYDKINEFGNKCGISWKNITYHDYIYTIHKHEGRLDKCEGTLYFKYDNSTFKIEFLSVNSGNEHKLASIGILEKESSDVNSNEESSMSIDSTVPYEDLEEEQRLMELAIQQAKEDSIKKAYEDSIAAIRHLNQ